MNEPIDMDLICNVFLQTVNQYGQLEKHLHTADQELCLSEIHTVAAVGAQEGINITALAKKQGISKSAVSQMVSKLVKKGYIIKKPSPETENEVVLELTQKGEDVRAEHEKQHQWLQEQMCIRDRLYPFSNCLAIRISFIIRNNNRSVPTLCRKENSGAAGRPDGGKGQKGKRG